MWKRWSLALLCLMLALALTGCATVNGDNSFTNAAPGSLGTQTAQTQNPGQAQPDGTQAPAAPTPEPTSDPNAGGYNG